MPVHHLGFCILIVVVGFLVVAAEYSIAQAVGSGEMIWNGKCSPVATERGLKMQCGPLPVLPMDEKTASKVTMDLLVGRAGNIQCRIYRDRMFGGRSAHCDMEKVAPVLEQEE